MQTYQIIALVSMVIAFVLLLTIYALFKLLYKPNRKCYKVIVSGISADQLRTKILASNFIIAFKITKLPNRQVQLEASNLDKSDLALLKLVVRNYHPMEIKKKGK